MNENYNLTDDFFEVSRKFLQLRKEQFFNSTQIEPLVNVTLSSLGLQHEDAAMSHQKLLSELLETLRYDFTRPLKLQSLS